MLCPRCGSTIKRGKLCKICGFQLEQEVRGNFKIVNLFKIVLSIFFLYYGVQLLLQRDILLTMLALLVNILIYPNFIKKINVLNNLNKSLRIIIIVVIFLIIGIHGNTAKLKNMSNNFIKQYELEDEFLKIGIDDIKYVEVISKFNHENYPSIHFQLTNLKDEKYSGLISGDKDGNYRLLSFTKYEDGVLKDYYAAYFDYDEDNRLEIDLYDYKTGMLVQEKDISNQISEVIQIQTGQNCKYSVNMPFESGNRIFYKFPENTKYRVTRKAVNDSSKSTSYIWQDYDEKQFDGNNVEYKNYDKYEFKNDDSIVYIIMTENTHLDLTGDYVYTFELYN